MEKEEFQKNTMYTLVEKRADADACAWAFSSPKQTAPEIIYYKFNNLGDDEVRI